MIDVAEQTYQLAIQSHQAGNFEQAESLYKQLLAQIGDNDAILANLGAVQSSMGRFEEGIATIDKAIKMNPANLEAWMNQGVARAGAGQRDAALESFKKVAELAPDRPDGYFNCGMLFANLGQFEEAISWCEKAIEIAPAFAPAHGAMGWVLAEMGRGTDALPYLEQSLRLQPNNFDTLVVLGNIHRDQKNVSEAIDAYEKALKLQPGHEGVTMNLSRVMRESIPPWHFVMLADTTRNDAYQAAIERAVTPDAIVLDIGTGSGLLAMMAARAGAKHVYACEMVPEMASIAQQVINDNNLQDQITIIPKKSTLLKVGEDLPEKADVLISEILDGGLLGEAVLPSVRHARQHLVKEDAPAIPLAATVAYQLVEMPLRRLVNPVREISGFDLSAFDKFRVSGEYIRVGLEAETHTALSEPKELQRFDLSHPPAPIADSHPLTTNLEVTAIADGTVHGVAFWFDLEVDEETTVSTRVGGDLRHWGQAMCFWEQELPVKAGETIAFHLELNDQMIRFKPGHVNND